MTDIPPPTDEMAPPPDAVSAPRFHVVQSGPDEPRQPSSFEAEREVLSTVLVDPDNVKRIRETLTAEQFYGDSHRLVFEAMCQLDDLGIPADPVTLQQHLVDTGNWERIGGFRTIAGLLDRIGYAGHLEHYCGIVRTKWAHRRLLALSESIRTIGFEGYETDSSLTEVERLVKRTAQAIDAGKRSQTGIGFIAEAHERMVDATTEAVAAGSTMAVPFGLPPLDAALNGGLWAGEQCVIMGSRGMGKSALSGQLIDANCAAGRRAIFVTLEMTAEQVLARLISNRCGVAYVRQRSGRMGPGERARVLEARSVIADWKLDIIEASGWPMSRIEREVRRIIRDEGEPSVAVLDYVQLVADSGDGAEATIRQASGRWSALAKEFKYAAVLLAQPVTASTRHDGGTPIPRPKMADAKGSGAIPDDADRFLVVHKPWWVPTKEGRDEIRSGGDDLLRRAEIAIDKDRAGGNVRVVQCRFNGSAMRFEDSAGW